MEKSFLCVSKNTMQITSIPGCILDIRDFSFLLLFESSIGHRMVEETGEKTKTYFHMKWRSM